MDHNEMRRRFTKNINAIIEIKRDDNKSFLSVDEYNKRIDEVKEAKALLSTPGSEKGMKHYRRVRKYDVITIGGKDRLIKPVAQTAESKVLYYVTNGELFDIIHNAHLAIGHGGRNRMIAEINKLYCNITKKTIMVYLRLCTQCQKKSSTPKKGLVPRPIPHSNLNSRAQVDLIDMQSQSYNDYRFIMVYQDHLTKFVLLKPLRTKRAEEVAFNLLEIYTTFGAPLILHSDNGREFVNSVLVDLHAMWPEVKIVHGKPRHSQSQGSVERANRDIEEMLGAWMDENQTTDWPSGMKFIQFKKNRALHSGKWVLCNTTKFRKI
ncbi:KRAB-A domain-containing protein 2-like [Photinus pyralis]|uniref:KRAB-A domain-containing protein 2-like n=1 Tax=Photinus pyralis TaxID=7054 RepID=UPI0012675EFB|nr:KRAB-A domain-containing protein 2-like [Photinus pyralis]XP_031348297.1 KRAB-A domain-containing protein 2-like [Photinus pyralis]XP_031348470.1 KRAB-A domain-containing protein 2-like [Photinus pyralis]